jgi:hypothetical protein
MLKSMAALPFAGALVWPHLAFAEDAFKDIASMEPGEFVWQPELSKQGPVAIIVSLTDQRVHVYRNGIRIAVSTCSTGRKGHRTPTGVFTVLQKDKHHHSSTYNNAPMPNMNRLTWSGIALHAGHLPGYPASHGCVRLPLKFSAHLFQVTHIGTPVIIAGGHSEPRDVIHPGLVLSRYAEDEFVDAEAALKNKALPGFSHEDNETAPVSVLISRADARIFVLENGEIVAEGTARIKDPGTALGSHVFVLSRPHDGRRGLQWHAIGFHHTDATGFAQPEESIIKRVGADQKVIDVMKQKMHPGMTLVLTDLPAHADTRSGRDFVIATAEDQ